MHPDDMMRLGVIGTLIASVFCFTPVPELFLAHFGFPVDGQFLAYIFYPVLVIAGAMLVYGAWKKEKVRTSNDDGGSDGGPDGA